MAMPALDDQGRSTFDFAKLHDAVLIGHQRWRVDAFVATTKANYKSTRCATSSTLERHLFGPASEGVNSFGFEESYNHYQVTAWMVGDWAMPPRPAMAKTSDDRRRLRAPLRHARH
jgi:hypothetical protein